MQQTSHEQRQSATAPGANRQARVKVYGAHWCGYTTRARAHLDRLGVPYEFLDTDADPAASEWVKRHNDGIELKPTIDVAGDILTAHQVDRLEDTLRSHGLI